MSDVRGVLVTHGAMAQGMVDAVRRITGAPDDALVALSNDGCSPEVLRDAIGGALGEGPVIVFTDLGAGSCTLAARLSCADRGRVAVISGVNLPMLLDFVFHRTLPVADLAERLAEKGREGVRILTAPKAHVDRPVPG